MFTGRRFGGDVVTSSSLEQDAPASGSSKPAIMRSVVVLPQPDSGRAARRTRPPRSRARRSLTTSFAPKRLLTSTSEIEAMRESTACKTPLSERLTKAGSDSDCFRGEPPRLFRAFWAARSDPPAVAGGLRPAAGRRGEVRRARVERRGQLAAGEHQGQAVRLEPEGWQARHCAENHVGPRPSVVPGQDGADEQAALRADDPDLARLVRDLERGREFAAADARPERAVPKVRPRLVQGPAARGHGQPGDAALALRQRTAPRTTRTRTTAES